MEDAQLKIRINYSVREVEVIGSETQVEKWYAKLTSDIADVAVDVPFMSASPLLARLNAVDISTSPGGSSAGSSLPQNFGEYFHRFRNDITDVDRMLVGGYFVERHSEAHSFKTAEANTLLREQGVRVTNPSEALRRNLAARRIFKVVGRDFRTARPLGVDHLRSLLLPGSTLD